MPKKMIWTELVFSYFPVKRTLGHQMLARLSLLSSVWIIGLIAYASDGLSMQYLSNIQIYSSLFGSSLIILFGSYMIQFHLHKIIMSFRPLLRLDETPFRGFAERLERYSYSIIPCLLIGVVLIVLSSNLLDGFQRALFEGFRPHTIWNLFFSIFVSLLSGTGTWFGLSIWLVIFMISRQPLDVELSPNTIEKFRGLTMLALYFSVFYFLTISIGYVIDLVGNPAASFVEFIFSPTVVFIAIGIMTVLFPFYNIHKALLGLKKQELQKIQEEFESLGHQLDEVLEGEPDQRSSDQTLAIMGRVFSLQMKERSVRAAPEWPVDINFLSRFLGLVFIPAAVRILVEIFNRLVISF